MGALKQRAQKRRSHFVQATADLAHPCQMSERLSPEHGITSQTHDLPSHAHEARRLPGRCARCTPCAHRRLARSHGQHNRRVEQQSPAAGRDLSRASGQEQGGRCAAEDVRGPSKTDLFGGQRLDAEVGQGATCVTDWVHGRHSCNHGRLPDAFIVRCAMPSWQAQ